VDGKLSNACYLRALDGCYQRYADRFERKFGTPFELDTADYAVFHAP
jgi:hydroxymethylglutaryl-CoA synthase